MRKTKTRNFKKERCWPRGVLLYELRLFGAMEKIMRQPQRDSGRTLCVGTKPRHVPPAFTRGAQRGAGGTWTHVAAPCKRGCSHTHPSTPSCSTAPKLGVRAGAPASPLACCCRGELAAGLQPGHAEVSLQNLPPPLSPHLLSFSASPSPLPAAAHPDAHQDEGLFPFH